MSDNKLRRKGWSQGKEYKDFGNKKSRNAEPDIITDELNQVDPKFKVKHKKKKKRSKQDKLRREILWYEKLIVRHLASPFWLALVKEYRSRVKKLRQKWEKLYPDEEV